MHMASGAREPLQEALNLRSPAIIPKFDSGMVCWLESSIRYLMQYRASSQDLSSTKSTEKACSVKSFS